MRRAGGEVSQPPPRRRRFRPGGDRGARRGCAPRAVGYRQSTGSESGGRGGCRHSLRTLDDPREQAPNEAHLHCTAVSDRRFGVLSRSHRGEAHGSSYLLPRRPRGRLVQRRPDPRVRHRARRERRHRARRVLLRPRRGSASTPRAAWSAPSTCGRRRSTRWRACGVVVATRVVSNALSAAAIMFSLGDERVVARDARLLYHRVRVSDPGEVSVDSLARLHGTLVRMDSDIVDRLVDRAMLARAEAPAEGGVRHRRGGGADALPRSPGDRVDAQCGRGAHRGAAARARHLRRQRGARGRPRRPGRALPRGVRPGVHAVRRARANARSGRLGGPPSRTAGAVAGSARSFPAAGRPRVALALRARGRGAARRPHPPCAHSRRDRQRQDGLGHSAHPLGDGARAGGRCGGRTRHRPQARARAPRSVRSRATRSSASTARRLRST